MAQFALFPDLLFICLEHLGMMPISIGKAHLSLLCLHYKLRTGFLFIFSGLKSFKIRFISILESKPLSIL